MTVNFRTLAMSGLVAVSLGACTSTATVHPDYVSAGVSAPVVQGRAVLVMDEAQRKQVISSHPTSFTGGGSSLVEPVGPIIETVGQKIFNAGFSGGATVSDKPAADAYDVIVHLDNYTYAFDQLSSLGLAITPKVTVSITANVRGPGDRALFHKTYARRDFTIGAYAASLHPEEKINQGLHMALGEIFRDILDDTAKAKVDDAAKAESQVDRRPGAPW